MAFAVKIQVVWADVDAGLKWQIGHEHGYEQIVLKIRVLHILKNFTGSVSFPSFCTAAELVSVAHKTATDGNCIANATFSTFWVSCIFDFVIPLIYQLKLLV